MCVDQLEVGNFYGSRMDYHGNILLRTNGRGGGGWRGRDKKFNSVGGRGRGEAETQSLNLWLVVPELLVGGWWWRESYSGIAGNTYFVYLALRTSALGMGQTVTLGKRNTLCCKSGMEIYFYLVL